MITLYIKTHQRTGLKYFGKTTKDPFKYSGSGVYWLRHLDKNGHNVDTEIYGVFDDVDLAEEVALEFSTKNNIVESQSWANLRPENGKDGAPPGCSGTVFSDEAKERIGATTKERWCDPDYKERLRNSQIKSWTPERKERQSKVASDWWSEERREAKSIEMKTKPPSDGFLSFTRSARSDDHKKNISRALSGKEKSPEHMKALSESRRKRSSESKEASLSKRRMSMFEPIEFNGQTFYGIRHASEVLGISPYKTKKLLGEDREEK